MWSDSRAATAWAFGWLLLVTAGFILVRRPAEGNTPRRIISWPLILLIALLARLLPALWLPVGAGYDIDSYRLVTDALLGGREVYASSVGRHPYLPFQMYIMGAMAYLSQVTGLPYVVAIKLPAIMADVALTGLIYRSSSLSKGLTWASYLALLYALNPASILVTAYHGQFEAVTLLLLLLAWGYWHREQIILSATLLGLAILNKTWPVLFLPAVWLRIQNWRDRITYPAIALGIPIIAIIAYLVTFSAEPTYMLRRALTHRGVAGYWGPGAVLNPAAAFWPELQPIVDFAFLIRNWLLLAAVIISLWWTRRQTALDAFLTLLLSIFAVTVGFGIQWLVWPIPFALLANEDRWLKPYSLAAAFMLVIHLYGLHMYPWLAEWIPAPTHEWLIRLSALPAWGIVIAWTYSRYRRAWTNSAGHMAVPDSLNP